MRIKDVLESILILVCILVILGNVVFLLYAKFGIVMRKAFLLVLGYFYINDLLGGFWIDLKTGLPNYLNIYASILVALIILILWLKS